MKITGYLLIFLAVIIGFFTRVTAVFQYVTFDIGPDPDQIKDAFTVINIWQGNFPTLGPQASIGRHHILPLYYYLFFPFTFLGPDPIFQAFPNALFSFLSIPLLIYLTYQLLENVKVSARFFLSGLAGFWYSILFCDIFINNFQWNPSSIPFFLLVFILLYKLEIEHKFSLLIQATLWSCYGVTLAILMSLHSSTLFIMPIIFLFSSLIFIFRAIRSNRKSLIFLPIISALSAIIVSLPYWIGELSRNFSNTKQIFKTLLNLSKSNNSNLLISLFEKSSNLFLNYIKLVEQVYFLNSSILYFIISIVFLSVFTYLGISRFRGNKYLWYLFCSIWLIYLLSSSNLDSTKALFFYKLPILSAPIILVIVSLAYLDYSQAINKIIAVFCTIIIMISSFHNLIYDYQFMLSKYGDNRLTSTTDIVNILSQLPSNSTICEPKIRFKREINNQYNYIDTHMTHKNLSIVDTCQIGDYLIYPKRILSIQSNLLNAQTYENAYYVHFMSSGSTVLWPIFKVEHNEHIQRKVKTFLETETAYVYILN